MWRGRRARKRRSDKHAAALHRGANRTPEIDSAGPRHPQPPARAGPGSGESAARASRAPRRIRGRNNSSNGVRSMVRSRAMRAASIREAADSDRDSDSPRSSRIAFSIGLGSLRDPWSEISFRMRLPGLRRYRPVRAAAPSRGRSDFRGGWSSSCGGSSPGVRGPLPAETCAPRLSGCSPRTRAGRREKSANDSSKMCRSASSLISAAASASRIGARSIPAAATAFIASIDSATEMRTPAARSAVDETYQLIAKRRHRLPVAEGGIIARAAPVRGFRLDLGAIVLMLEQHAERGSDRVGVELLHAQPHAARAPSRASRRSRAACAVRACAPRRRSARPRRRAAHRVPEL